MIAARCLVSEGDISSLPSYAIVVFEQREQLHLGKNVRNQGEARGKSDLIELDGIPRVEHGQMQLSLVELQR